MEVCGSHSYSYDALTATFSTTLPMHRAQIPCSTVLKINQMEEIDEAKSSGPKPASPQADFSGATSGQSALRPFKKPVQGPLLYPTRWLPRRDYPGTKAGRDD